MGPKLFLTGATGFIGGDVLHVIAQEHPDWELTCLVRDVKKQAMVAARYPRTRFVIGDNSCVDLIEDEVSKADIIIHTAASDDDLPSAQAIAAGLARRHLDNPAYWLHTSGFLSLALETLSTGRFGDRFDKVYDDWNGLTELVNHPEHAPHRAVEKVVLAAGNDKVKTAIVCPSVVYGEGRGPVKTSSFPLFGTFAKHGSAFGVGMGENIWHNIHVQDLSGIYLLLLEAAVTGTPDALWNEQGYYFAENGCYVLKEMLDLAGKIGYEEKWLKSPDVSLLTPDEADEILPYARFVLGVNSRGLGYRAKRVLGWKPHMPAFEDEISSAFAKLEKK